VRLRAICILAALVPALAMASSAHAGTVTLGFPAASLEGDDEIVIIYTALTPGETNPAIRVHAPSQQHGCPGQASDSGTRLPPWSDWENTTVQESPGSGSWTPREAGTYEFCIYFADGTSQTVDRQVVQPLTYTLTVAPGAPGTPSVVAVTGQISPLFHQTMGIELKYHAAGGAPCNPTPYLDPGAPVPIPGDPPSAYYHYWILDKLDAALDFAISAPTAPLAPGTYLLCMWEAPIGDQPDLIDVTFGSSTMFTVATPVDARTLTTGASPPATPTQPPRNVAAPTLTGRFRVGSILQCGTGRWSSPPKVASYRWYRGTRRIARASAASYRVRGIDAGARLHCQVVLAGTPAHPTSKASASHAVMRN
jgi:hypothetical protein